MSKNYILTLPPAWLLVATRICSLNVSYSKIQSEFWEFLLGWKVQRILRDTANDLIKNGKITPGRQRGWWGDDTSHECYWDCSEVTFKSNLTSEDFWGKPSILMTDEILQGRLCTFLVLPESCMRRRQSAYYMTCSAPLMLGLDHLGWKYVLQDIGSCGLSI